MDDQPATTPSWHRQCVCGHMEGDHKSNRAPIAGRLRFGVCLRRGCDCREFHDLRLHNALVENRLLRDLMATLGGLPLEVTVEENRRLRELLATLGWGPTRIAEHLAVVPTPGVESPQRP